MAVPGPSKPDLGAEIEKYRKSLEENPGSRMFVALAEALRRQGDIQQAIAVAEDGLKKHPRYIRGMVVLAQCYFDHSELDRARELFQQVVRMDPENILAQRTLAEIYDSKGDNYNAVRTYGILLILDPADKKARARLQELELTRSGGPPTPSSPRPFETPPTPAIQAAQETGPVPGSPPDSPAAEPAVSPAAEPVESPADGPSAAPETPTSAATLTAPESAPLPPAPPAAAEPAPAASDSPAPPEAESESLPETPAVRDQNERLRGLDQFFADEKTVELDQEPFARPRPDPPAAVPDSAPAQAAVPDSTSAQAAEPSPEDSATLELPPPLTPEPPPQPRLSEEEKLELFFAGVRLDTLGIAARADGFVVKAAEGALEEPPPPPAPETPATTEVTVTRSKMGAIFWSQGFREKALNVMAGEVLSRPDDAELREEFDRAAQSIDQDPDALLKSVATVDKPAPAPADAPAPAQPAPRPPAPPAPEPAPDAPPPEPSATEPEAASVLKAAPGEPLPASDRINILKSYLSRIRKDKES